MAGRNKRQLQVKDELGLTLEQRKLLSELALSDWRSACETLNINPRTARSWLLGPEFRAAYDGLVSTGVETARKVMENKAFRATEMYDEALDAMRTIEQEVICPHCDTPFTAEISVPDWNPRLRAGEVILKVARIYKDVREQETIITHLGLEERLALAKYKYALEHGQDPNIPPALMERIRPHLAPVITVEEVTA